MKRSIRVTTGVVLLALSLFCAASVMAQDPAKVAPDIYKVRLDNAKVRVLEVTGKAGQKAAMHRHPNYVVYSLADGSARHTDPKGVVSDSSLSAGQAIWRDAESHASEVVSDIHVLLFELKGPKGPKGKAVGHAAKADDAVSVDPPATTRCCLITNTSACSNSAARRARRRRCTRTRTTSPIASKGARHLSPIPKASPSKPSPRPARCAGTRQRRTPVRIQATRSCTS